MRFRVWTNRFHLYKMISLVIPTYNERTTISELIEKVESIFTEHGIKGEVIVVDDNSKDGTAEAVIKLSKAYPDIRLIQRSGKRGLSSATIDGFTVAHGEILGLIDADLSHDPSIIPNMVDIIQRDEADIVVGSRYIKEGGIDKSWTFKRRFLSKLGACLARPLTHVMDPLSGYFFMKAETIKGVRLNSMGFKILLEVLVRGRYSKVKEVPYYFSDRAGGKSKFGPKIGLNYLLQLLRLYALNIGRFLRNLA